MDDGYRILNHTVRQLVGNLGQAIKITLIPMILPCAMLIALTSQVDLRVLDGYYQVDGDVREGSFFAIFAGLILVLIGFAWAAVAWHRFVLIAEYPKGIAPSFSWGWVGPYLGRSFIIGIVILIALLIGGTIANILVGALRSRTLGFLAESGLTLGASWLSVRIGLILPAAALGRSMSLSESWEATRPVSGDLLVPVFVLTVAVAIAGLLLPSLFGYGLMSLVVGAVVIWLQVMFNLSLMTTLYGMQIERRPLI